MKLKKLFKLSAFLTFASPLAFAVSCETTSSIAEKTYFVTDGNDINDVSLNGPVWHGFNDIFGRLTNSLKNVYQPESESDIPNVYNTIKNKGGKLIICAGPSHKEYVEAAAQANKDLRFLYLDGIIANKNVASVAFDLKAPAFIMGIFAAKNAHDMAKKTNIYDAGQVGVYGTENSSSFEGEDTLKAFQAGVDYYNAHNKDKVTVKVLGGDSSSDENGKANRIANKLITLSKSDGAKSSITARDLIQGKNGDHVEVVLAIGDQQYNDLITAINEQGFNKDGKKEIQIIKVETSLKDETEKIESENINWTLGSIKRNLQLATKNVGKKAVSDIVKHSKNSLVKTLFGKTHWGTMDNQEVSLVFGDKVGTAANNYFITNELLARLVKDPKVSNPVALKVADILAAARSVKV